MDKQSWDDTLSKIVEAVCAIDTTGDEQTILKYSLAYTIYKLAETESLYVDNLRILDEHSENGLCKRRKLKYEENNGNRGA